MLLLPWPNVIFSWSWDSINCYHVWDWFKAHIHTFALSKFLKSKTESSRKVKASRRRKVIIDVESDNWKKSLQCIVPKMYVTRQCDGGSVDRRWIEVICLSTARSATAFKKIEIFVESEKNGKAWLLLRKVKIGNKLLYLWRKSWLHCTTPHQVLWKGSNVFLRKLRCNQLDLFISALSPYQALFWSWYNKLCICTKRGWNNSTGIFNKGYIENTTVQFKQARFLISWGHEKK